MAGRPGRSGGANRISPRDHLLRGTFIPGRHGAALTAASAIWQPEDGLLGRLGDDGRAFVERLRGTYDLSPMEGELVLEAAVAVDRLAEIRRTREAVELKERMALDKVEQLWQKQLTALLAGMRVRA